LEALEDRAAPAAFNVNSLADTHATDFTKGTDASGHITLRSAIEAANHLAGSNTINVPAGTINLTLGQLDIRAQLDVLNFLTINGAPISGTALNGNLTNSTIINAGLRSRIFSIGCQAIACSFVTISNMMLEQGVAIGTGAPFATGVGGAIFDFGVLTLQNCTLLENFAFGGNGAAGSPGANGADATSGAAATAGSPGGDGQSGGVGGGGAIWMGLSSSLTLINSVVKDNAAFQGTGGVGGQGGNGGSDVNGQGAAGGAGGNGGAGGSAFGGAILSLGNFGGGPNSALTIEKSVFANNFAGLAGFSIIPVVGGGTGGAGGSGGAGLNSGGQGGRGGNGGAGGGLDEGGAIFDYPGSSVTITDSSFSRNTALGEEAGAGGVGGAGGGGGDGGIGGTGGTGGSPGASFGGAIYNLGTMTIDSSSFFSNQATAKNAGAGGAGGNGGGSSIAAGGNGGNGGNGGFGGAGTAGGIDSFSGSLTLTHSTVSVNTAGSGAGGAGGSGGLPGPGSPFGAPGSAGSTGVPARGLTGGLLTALPRPQIFDTIIAGNTAPVNIDVNGDFVSLGHNLIGDGSGSAGFGAAGDQVGTSTKPIKPLLTVVGNFLVPQQTSLALQAGDPTNAPATDERGLPRIVDDDANLDNDGAKIDIGAVEFQPTDPSVTVSGSPSNISPGGTITYTITIKTGKGDNKVSNVTLTDQVPGQTTFQSFTFPAGWKVKTPAVGGTGTVTATFAALAPSSTASFTFQVKVKTAPTASSTTNTATITTNSPDSTTADNSASVKTTILVGWLAVVADAGGGPEVAIAAAPTSVVTASAPSPTEAALPNFLAPTTSADPFGAWTDKHRSLLDDDTQLQDLFVADVLSQHYGNVPVILD
jgi:uncharacterized repeat protein (TIGR01451 family)